MAGIQYTFTLNVSLKTIVVKMKLMMESKRPMRFRSLYVPSSYIKKTMRNKVFKAAERKTSVAIKLDPDIPDSPTIWNPK